MVLLPRLTPPNYAATMLALLALPDPHVVLRDHDPPDFLRPWPQADRRYGSANRVLTRAERAELTRRKKRRHRRRKRLLQRAARKRERMGRK